MTGVGSTVVLTGATSGIGLAAAQMFAADAGCLILHGRQPKEKVEPLLRELRAKRPDARLHYLRADFSDLTDVDALARDVSDLTDRIDLLINNAGCAGPSRRTVLPNGNEVTFQVNYLAPVSLTTMLLPLLGTSAPGRIVNIASATHYSPPRLDLEDLDLGDHRYSAYDAYANSKLALGAWSCGLARNRPSGQVEVVSMHPGVIATKILREMVGGGGDPPEVGAANIRYVAARHGDNGAYYDKRRRADPNPEASDPVIQDTLHARTSALLRGLATRHSA